MKKITFALVILAIATLGGCMSDGTTTTPVSTQGAQNIGRDQRQASGTDSGSAVTTNNMLSMPIIGGGKIVIGTGRNGIEVEVEASPANETTVNAANFHGNVMGEAAVSTSNNQGGVAQQGDGDNN